MLLHLCGIIFMGVTLDLVLFCQIIIIIGIKNYKAFFMLIKALIICLALDKLNENRLYSFHADPYPYSINGSLCF